MGFLDHSTNNIIVDAVLTDAGRRALARNDGSFQIAMFALGDDEVDYGIISKFGRNVGKEKIEKNTPIIEALTAGSLALKNKLVTIDNEYVTHFPAMTIKADSDSTDNVTTFSRAANGIKTRNILIDVQPAAGTPEIDPQLVDSAFRIEMNHIFLQIDNDQPDIIYTDNIAVYERDAVAGKLNIAATSNFNMSIKGITDTTFNIYSSGNFIKTFVKVTGLNSGLSKTFEVRINNN
jgi:hypothetical protein|tara:strand:- start:723 stop:1427 length:705 start_codon:yes stop_codon:yes gene_type:complete